jgi:hypothetical protein
MHAKEDTHNYQNNAGMPLKCFEPHQRSNKKNNVTCLDVKTFKKLDLVRSLFLMSAG